MNDVPGARQSRDLACTAVQVKSLLLRQKNHLISYRIKWFFLVLGYLFASEIIYRMSRKQSV